MRSTAGTSLILGFVAAVVVATVWGAIVQTQFNLAGLASIGVEVSAGLRLRTTFADIFSGFSPTYGGYVVMPSLLVAFLIASGVTANQKIKSASGRNASRSVWFALAGGLAILLGIPLVNYLAPVALLVGASRDMLCTVLMALGGAAAGLLFVRIYVPSLHRATVSRDVPHAVAAP